MQMLHNKDLTTNNTQEHKGQIRLIRLCQILWTDETKINLYQNNVKKKV